MSLINRPFRGFSGTFTRPELPLEHPEITLERPTDLVSELTRCPDTNANAAPPHHHKSAQNMQSAPRSSAHAAKKHLFTGIFSIFSGKQSGSKPNRKPHEDKSKRPKGKNESREDRNQSCEAKNSSNVVIYCGKEFSEKEKITIPAEIDQLYMAVYTKAERRKFYRESKKRECEEMERLEPEYAVREDEEAEEAHVNVNVNVNVASSLHETLPAEARALRPDAPSELAPDAASGSMTDSAEACAVQTLPLWTDYLSANSASSSTIGHISSVFTAGSSGSSSMSSGYEDDRGCESGIKACEVGRKDSGWTCQGVP